MNDIELSQDDKETLQLELTNSINGRLKNIKKGIWITLIGIGMSVVFSNVNGRELNNILDRLVGAAKLISIITIAYGLFQIIFWFLTMKSINRLKDDLRREERNPAS